MLFQLDFKCKFLDKFMSLASSFLRTFRSLGVPDLYIASLSAHYERGQIFPPSVQ